MTTKKFDSITILSSRMLNRVQHRYKEAIARSLHKCSTGTSIKVRLGTRVARAYRIEHFDKIGAGSAKYLSFLYN